MLVDWYAEMSSKNFSNGAAIVIRLSVIDQRNSLALIPGPNTRERSSIVVKGSSQLPQYVQYCVEADDNKCARVRKPGVMDCRVSRARHLRAGLIPTLL